MIQKTIANTILRQNMARHPRTSPIKPLNVRDNNIPTNSPLMIVPTTLPRSSSA
jgi:hypothetical protein